MSVMTIIMSKLNIDVEVLKKRTIIVMSRLRDVTDISLETFINVFHVLINKIENIKKENILRENVLEKLEYS